MLISKEEIGGRIKQALVAARIKQKELAEAIGVSEPTINAYIQGRTEPTGAGYAIIAKICGVSIDWLITGQKPEGKAIEPPEITYPLAEDEKRAIHTAEDLLRYKGLDKRFAVVEVHHPPLPEERLSDEEKRLLESFRRVDGNSRKMILQVADNAALVSTSKERGHPEKDLKELKSA